MAHVALLALLITSASHAPTAADLTQQIGAVLHGESSTAADCQRTLALLLGRRAEAASGVVASGACVGVRDLSIDELAKAWAADGGVLHRVSLRARGPEAAQLYFPIASEESGLDVFHREGSGPYVKLLRAPIRLGKFAAIEAGRPGEYLVRRATASAAHAKNELFDNTPTTSDPSARVDWGLYPVRPWRIDGPVPVILIHGLATDRWREFIAWADTSCEAQAFRDNFQLWDFYHDATGIDAAVGFSPDYPAYEQSIIVYLERFIREAMTNGVSDGHRVRCFPDGPFMMITDSTGGLKARAFLKNFPSYQERVLGVAAIAAPQVGTPMAIPEWLRHTVTRLAPDPTPKDTLLLGLLGEYFSTLFMRTDRQSDLDMGWGNFDAQGGFGLPTVDFDLWRPKLGTTHISLSPRDANQTGARELPGYTDTTFDPVEVRATYCGGLDAVMPTARGEDGLDKFFAYGSYLSTPPEWFEDIQSGEKALENAYQESDFIKAIPEWLQNEGLAMAAIVIGVTASEGTDYPLGAYLLNDGIIPLQSEMFLDGKETELLYETEVRADGYTYPVVPYQPRMEIFRAHTLFDPDRLRILRDWSHLDTATGRYNRLTHHSELYSMVAEDLVSVAPETE